MQHPIPMVNINHYMVLQPLDVLGMRGKKLMNIRVLLYLVGEMLKLGIIVPLMMVIK